MKGYKLDLLTLLIGLFILGACNNPDEIGLDLDSGNGINSDLIETTPIQVTTVLDEKVFTEGLSEYPIGYFKDPVMGTTQAGVAATLTLPSAALTFGDTPVLDSAVLVLRYGSNFYGDSMNSTYHFTVHQLTDKLSTSTSYYNDTPIPFNNTEIGSLTFNKVKMKDSILVTQIREGKSDTTFKHPPQIRIPISSSFINTNFLNAASTNFANSTSFIDFIKGIYIKTDEPGGADAGGIPFFDLGSSGASKLELYYHNGSSETKYVAFNINSTSNTVVANFSHDYTGTAVETQLNNPGGTYDQVFTQGLAGVRSKVIFPDLSNLKALGNIVINKAILEIKVDAGTDVPFAPASRLMLYRTDIASQRKLFPDLDPYDARSVGLDGFGGVYNSTTKTYNFIVTTYLQDILSNKSKQYAAYLGVINKSLTTLQSAYDPSATTAERSILASPTNSGLPMKLRVFYTKID